MEKLPVLEALRNGGKALVSRVLSRVEAAPEAAATLDLLDEAFASPYGQIIGVTGPPGVGKSSLINALISRWRRDDLSVAVVAVDPSSRRSGGALLGDRTRMMTDPADRKVFVRSMAARERLGGLSSHTVAVAVLLRALFDVVIVETVGVGQSEADIASLADTVLFCVQPGSGDSLQFMKAGIMEVPHIAAVTKNDLGAQARRAVADLEGALSLYEREDLEDWHVTVHAVSAQTGDGIDQLVAEFGNHFKWLKKNDRLSRTRHIQAQSWLKDAVLARFGQDGIERAGQRITLQQKDSPFRRQFEIGLLINDFRR